MFLFQYHRDNLRLLEEEHKRGERRNRLLREVHELRSASSPIGAHRPHSQAARPPTGPYAGPERRLVPCPEMKEAMTP